MVFFEDLEVQGALQDISIILFLILSVFIKYENFSVTIIENIEVVCISIGKDFGRIFERLVQACDGKIILFATGILEDFSVLYKDPDGSVNTQALSFT